MNRYGILLKKKMTINPKKIEESIEIKSRTLPKFEPCGALRSEDLNYMVGAIEELQHKISIIYKALEIA